MKNLTITANLAISLDGKIEGPNGEFDWCFTDQDYGMKNFLSKTDLIICGGNSYRMLCEHKVNVEEEFGSIPWVVFTCKELQKQNGITITNQPPEVYLREMIGDEIQNIWLFGGALLFQYLLRKKLIHDMLLSVHPIILGSGKPFFESIDKRIQLEFINCIQYETGLLQSHYKINYGNEEKNVG
ncbi:MAG: dihydrofolate reductase family protein [Cyclobacteriaceae bacterium]|jgi:dihydrofolate reductase|nr:dihydrofolate reductase family protein [Cyclobacteriaceae bacterium]